MWKFFSVIFVIFLINQNYGQILKTGDCEENSVDLMTAFDPIKYTGRWFEIHTYRADNSNRSLVTYDFANSSVHYMGEINGEMFHDDYEIEMDNVTNSLLNLLHPTTNESIPHWILDTNYDSYSLVYGCEPHNETFSYIYSWILSREELLEPADIIEMNSKMIAAKLSWNNYVRTNQVPECSGSMANRAIAILLFIAFCSTRIF